MLTDLNLAIIDVETTGPSALYDRVIEIGITRVEKGKAVSTYSSLVDPECRIPSNIERLTGITNDAIEQAPTFSSIQNNVFELLEGCVFVAHNVRFDYSFIKNEFRRLNRLFSAKCLCTVRLSRLLYPRWRRHGLSSLIARFQFPCPNRHRALDDANVVWSFLQHAHQTIDEGKFFNAMDTLLERPTLPPGLPPEQVECLPDEPGVYVFYDEAKMPLYVGKSVNVRSRVLSHFSNDHRSGKDMAMSQRVIHIEARQTHGELGALLLEAQLIQTVSPLFNRRSRAARSLTVIRKIASQDCYDQVAIEQSQDIIPEEHEQLLGIFRSRKQAKDVLAGVARKYRLCPMKLGLLKTSKTCMARQLKSCAGACAGEDPPAFFNARLVSAFADRKLRTWPYSGPVVIEEASPDRRSGEVFIIDQWKLVQALTYDEGGCSRFFEPQQAFDYASYKILVSYILKQPRSVKPVTQEQVEALSNSS